jgi:hypothetical protein
MQLVAYGAQDIYLTGNPQITFFKVVYRRHTNFSMESIQQTFNGSVSYGSTVSATISRNGDLVHKMYVQWKPGNTGASYFSSGNLGANVSHTLLNQMEVEIGGQLIDRQYGHWLTTWTDLTEPNATGTKQVVGAAGAEPVAQTDLGDSTCTKYQLMSYNHAGLASQTTLSAAPAFAYIPLQFWFCRNPGLALPLIALQYHEVKVKITFCAGVDINSGGLAAGKVLSTLDPQLWADYIYLDTDERRRFAQVSHEYLIEQLQFESKTSGLTMELNFNHPVKELIWIGTPAAANVKTSLGTPAVAGSSSNTYQLKLNGHDRFAARPYTYFTRTQVWQHHTGFGGTTVRDSIAVYSFALKPEEHQPSGTCNFSRIDNAQLVGTGSENIYIYAINYNVLRIMSGMGGLAYSN